MYRLILIAFCFVSFAARAQHPRVISSTTQSWSGGIAGHHGSNYTFSIEFTDCKQAPWPDTLWVGGHRFLCTVSSPGMQGNTTVVFNRKRKTATIGINVGYSADDYAERNRLPGGAETVLPKPPTYGGVALLQYSYRGKQKAFAVPGFTRTYPAVNYP